MRIIDCEQGTEAWFAARCGIPTASEFAAILAKGRDGGEAVTRRNYRARLVVERVTGRPVVSGFSNGSTKQGTEREPAARDAYMVRTGNLVQQVGVCLHDELAAGASPDGLVDADGGTEIKCPELPTHLDYLRRTNEPPEYRAQIQGCMWITGRAWWDFISFNPDFPPNLQLVVRRVERDDKYIAALELAVRLFIDEVTAEVDELSKLAA
jgi:hypothetical protein